MIILVVACGFILCFLITLFFSLAAKAFTSIDAIEFKHLCEKQLNKKDQDWWTENLNTIIGILSIIKTLLEFVFVFLLGFLLLKQLPLSPIGSLVSLLVLFIVFAGVVIYRLVTVNVYLDFYLHFISNMLRPFKKYLAFLVPLFKELALYASNLTNSLLKNYRHDPDVVEVMGSASDNLQGEPLPEDKKEMIYSIYDMGETIVREIMVPRVNMVCIDQNETIIKGLELINNTGHSRIPVYQDDIDHIVGLFYAKDILRYWQEHNENITIKELIRDVFFIPETKHISELLSEFQQQKNHIAVVVDEYGGTAGLITIEDILEEIVGEIRDEYDQENEKPIQFLEDGSVVCDAKVLIDDITDELGIDFPDREDYDTLGGFLFSQLEKIPSQGEVIHYRNWRFVISKSDERSIKKVKIIKAKRKNAKKKESS